eukprot:m.9570 g.9570  ORF g.9570 m.9570 type:complete len:193 (-) comp5467_c0_seq1:370-948(-)
MEYLLQAPSKEAINDLFDVAFKAGSGTVSDSKVLRAAEAMQLQPEQVQEMFQAIAAFIKKAVFAGVQSKQQVVDLLPSDMHKKLKSIVAGVVGANIATWNEQAIVDQTSLPKLVDFDWRVDVKVSSDDVARMSMPTTIVNMKVNDPPTKVGQAPSTSTVSFEVNKETLETMLDGLGRIRDQLSAVAESSESA